MNIAGLLTFGSGAKGADAARRRFGGLTCLERGIRTMARAGVRRLLVVVPDGVEPRLGKVTRRLDLDLEFVRWGDTPHNTFAAGDQVLVLAGDHVHHHSGLTGLVEHGIAGHDLLLQQSPPPDQSLDFITTYEGDDGLRLATAEGDGGPAAAVFTGALLCDGGLHPHEAVAARREPLALLLERAGAGRVGICDGDARLWRRVVDGRSARQAKAMLFDQVTKKTSGPVSRHINARLSIPISKVLIETGISPHMVTVLFVLTAGLSTAALMIHPEPYWRLALAGFLWQMAAVLDRCDGEIARVKLCESKFGAWFDTVTDNIAYLAAYVAFLFGAAHLYPDRPWVLYLGLSAIAAMGVTLGVMYNYALKTGSGSLQNYLVGFARYVPPHEKNALYRAFERYAFVAKRDFFSFVHFLCAVAGSFELLYAYTVGILHFMALAVLISQRKMLEGHRRRVAAEQTTPPATALAPAPRTAHAAATAPPAAHPEGG